MENRRRNLEEARKLVGDPYPFDYPVTATVSQIGAAHRARSGEELEREPIAVSTAGRILARRTQGKAGFLDVSDGTDRVQVYVRRDAVGEAGWALYGLLDLGDWLGVSGKVFKTRTGELTVKAESSHCSPSVSVRFPRSGTASRTSSAATASVTSTSR